MGLAMEIEMMEEVALVMQIVLAAKKSALARMFALVEVAPTVRIVRAMGPVSAMKYALKVDTVRAMK